MEDNILVVTMIVFAILLFLLASGVYIAFALLLTGLLVLWIFTPELVRSAAFHLFNSVNDFVLVAVPLFIFMGNIILHSGLTEKLYRGVTKITEVLPGGLVHTNIAACSIFAAITGSATATCVTIGTIAIPEQLARGYNRKIIMGSLLSGGTLGVLIPPSIIMIIYGAFVKVSVARLFLGGFLPGFLLAGMFMLLTAVATSFWWKSWVPPRRKLTWGYVPRAFSSITDIWPFMLMIVLILGSIYTGQATPTEAAALSGFIALGMAALFRKLNFTSVRTATLEALRTTCFVAICIVGGRLLGVAMSMIKLPALLISLVTGLGFDPVVVWIIIIAAYLILGMLMEDVSLMIVTLPVTFPLMTQLGFDPVWFGVQLTILIQLAMITPPVGVVLYVMQGISKETPIQHIIQGSLPYVGVMVVSIAIFTAFPQIILWLPNMMFGG
ncbi:MAG: TRAP transporter large permease subunit [Chloroflexi bacterium]|nr:TRAP transporter large permease subunit [Chloroflexota bacterium]